MAVKRFGVSLENNLLDALDSIVENKKFPNRSQAIRYLINNYKSIHSVSENQIVTGAIVLVYDHRNLKLHAKVAGFQHEYNCLVLSSQHIHIDDQNCIETIAVKGSAQRVINLSNKLLAIKGIRHGNLVMSSLENSKNNVHSL